MEVEIASHERAAKVSHLTSFSRGQKCIFPGACKKMTSLRDLGSDTRPREILLEHALATLELDTLGL